MIYLSIFTLILLFIFSPSCSHSLPTPLVLPFHVHVISPVGSTNERICGNYLSECCSFHFNFIIFCHNSVFFVAEYNFIVRFYHIFLIHPFIGRHVGWFYNLIICTHSVPINVCAGRYHCTILTLILLVTYIGVAGLPGDLQVTLAREAGRCSSLSPPNSIPQPHSKSCSRAPTKEASPSSLTPISHSY